MLKSSRKRPRWKWVRRYKGLYRVSTKGVVKSVTRYVLGRNGTLRKIKGRILSQYKNKSNGRMQINLWKGNKGTAHYIHHIVLESFIGPRPVGMEACHFPDRNPENNYLSNLRWDTSSNNKGDMIFHKTRRYGKDTGAVLDEEQVTKIKSVLKKKGHIRGIVSQQARKYNVCPNTIRDIKLGITWGYIHA